MADDPRVEAAFDAYLGEIMKHSNERKAMRAALTAADRVALANAPELANAYALCADWPECGTNEAGNFIVPPEKFLALLTLRNAAPAQAARIAELEPFAKYYVTGSSRWIDNG